MPSGDGSAGRGALIAGPLAGKAQAVQPDLAASSGNGLQTQAAETDPAATTDAELKAQGVKKYSIWVGGKQVTSKNAKNVLGTKKKTVTYNAKTNTLTLNGAKIAKAYVAKTSTGLTYRYGILSRQARGLTVVLKGANKVSVPGTGKVANYGISVCDASGTPLNLTIKGTGSLHAKAGKAGLFSFGLLCQNLNIMGSAKVTAIGGSRVSTSVKANDSAKSAVGSYGAYTTGFLALGGSSKLTASGKTKALNRSATYSQGYTPQVKAGASAKSIKVNKKNPASSVYTNYKYVSISKAAKSSKSSKSPSGKKPAKVALTSAYGIVGGVAFQWKMPAKNCTHYQTQVSEYSTFNKIATWNSNVYSAGPSYQVTYKRTGLADGITYYVRAGGAAG